MMKTKFLLAAIALPLAFTACTSEDVIEAGNGQLANIESRAALADITFVAGGVDSRVTTDGNGKWEWENTDKFSAHLIDAATKFSVADTDTALYTNYIYSKTAEGYTTTSQMVEGMYWFYAPANENKVDRHMMTFEFPTEQTYDEADPTATLLAQSVWFSPVYKMEAKNNTANVKVPLTMYNWYATALMAFKNNGTTSLDIQKIIVETTEGLPVKGGISVGEIEKDFTLVYKNGAWVDRTNDAGQSTNATKPMEKDYIYGTPKTNKVFILNCTKALEAGEIFTAKMLMPAGNAGAVNVYVVLQDGTSILVPQSSAVKFNHHAQKSIFGVNNGAPVVKPITAKSAQDRPLNYVQNNEDILTLLNSNSTDIHMKKIGEWALNEAVVKAISEYSAKVKFDNGVTNLELVSGTDTENVITLKNLLNPITLKSGLLKIGNYYVDDDADTKVVYKQDITVKGGELTLTGKTYGTITNEGGKITLSHVEGDPAIDENMAITSIANNKGELVFATSNEISAAAIAALSNGVYSNDGVSTNDKVGKITINANKTLTVGVTETLLAAANSEVVVNGNVVVTAEVLVNSNGKITIAEDATLVGNNAFSNYGTIEVSGEISGVVNHKNIKAAASTSRIEVVHADSNNPAGKIDNTNLAFVSTENVSGSDKSAQIIFYEVSTAIDNAGLATLDKNIKGYGINALKFSAAVSLNGLLKDSEGDEVALYGVDRLIFASGSSLKLGNGTAQNLNISNLDIESNVTFAGYDKTKSVIGFTKDVNVNIAYNATLTVKHMTMAAISAITVEGTPATVNSNINFYLDNKKTSTTYTSWGCVKNEGEIKVNDGKIYDATKTTSNEIAKSALVDEATTTRGANWIGDAALASTVAVTVSAAGEITWN